jgi:mono/diheme cytochrome c family protein
MKSSILSTVLLLTGCEGLFPAPDWEQMIRQRKALPYAASQWFPDGRAMQPPPEHTVPRDRLVDQPALTEGRVNGQYINRIPIVIDRALLDSGHRAFDIYCAACHGLAGDGDSDVAPNMDLRKPPSLVSEQARALPPGRVFQVETLGYGLMPSWERELSVRERWAVVAYLRALQLSQSARLDELPPDVRAAAERALAKDSR